MVHHLALLLLAAFLPPTEHKNATSWDAGSKGPLVHVTNGIHTFAALSTDAGVIRVKVDDTGFVATGPDGGNVPIQGTVGAVGQDGGLLHAQVHGVDENGTMWPFATTDEGRLRTVSEPVELYVNRDAIFDGKDSRVIAVLGRRDQGWNSTTALGDVCQYLDTSQNLENEVDAGTTYYLRSSSANDTVDGGTGARTVRITYLPADGGIEATLTSNLNGADAVSLGDGFDAFQWAEVASLGTSQVNEGSITISSTSGAGTPPVSTIVEYIAVGGNRSLSGRYKVPPGYTGYALDWGGSAIGNDQDMRIRAQAFSDNGHALSSVYHFFGTRYVVGNTTEFNTGLHYYRIPAGADVKVSSIPKASAAANRADVNFYLLLIAN